MVNRLSIDRAARFHSCPQQFYFTSNLVRSDLMFSPGPGQVKQSVAVTIDRTPVAPFKTGALSQLDPMRHATGNHKLAHRRARALQFLIIGIAF